MKTQSWRLTLDRHEENLSGGRFSSEQELYWGWQMTPTVQMVRTTIQHFAPDFQPDERYMSLKEQIMDGLDCGCFDILLRPKDGNEIEFESWSMGFMTV